MCIVFFIMKSTAVQNHPFSVKLCLNKLCFFIKGVFLIDSISDRESNTVYVSQHQLLTPDQFPLLVIADGEKIDAPA